MPRVSLLSRCNPTSLLSRYTITRSNALYTPARLIRTFSAAAPLRKPQLGTWPYLYSANRIMAPQLDSYFKQVDTLADSFIDRLRRAVAIPSVSADEERRPDVVRVCIHPPTYTASC